MRHAAGFSTLGAALLLAACGGRERPVDSGSSDSITAASAPAAPSPSGAGSADPASPQLIALGDSIFRGLVAGGTCMTCHGQNGVGGQIGPNLTDAEWLHGDGSYGFSVATVTNGVSTPKKFPAMMPPKGGAPLSTEQVRAVAAYVFSLGRRAAS